MADGLIVNKKSTLREYDNTTPESYIQALFFTIVDGIALKLNLNVTPFTETNFIVGGILVEYEYDLKGRSDPHFRNSVGRNLIASEIKTHQSFGYGDAWHQDSRGIQLLSSLYTFNCPTFLVTQKQWKLLVENTERNWVLTFPFGSNEGYPQHGNSLLCAQMGRDFLKAIVICLLSRRPLLSVPIKPQTSQTSSQILLTPEWIESAAKKVYSGEKVKPYQGPTTRARSKVAKKGLFKDPRPSFVSGYVSGQPVYSFIRITPQHVVLKIEEEIAKEEQMGAMEQESSVAEGLMTDSEDRKGFNRQSSDETLNE